MPTYDYLYRAVLEELQEGKTGSKVAQSIGIPKRTAQRITSKLKGNGMTLEGLSSLSFNISWGKLNPEIQDRLIQRYDGQPIDRTTERTTKPTTNKKVPVNASTQKTTERTTERTTEATRPTEAPIQRPTNGTTKRTTAEDEKALAEMLTWWKDRGQIAKQEEVNGKTEVLKVRIPTNLLADLKAEAEARHTSLSAVVRGRLQA